MSRTRILRTESEDYGDGNWSEEFSDHAGVKTNDELNHVVNEDLQLKSDGVLADSGNCDTLTTDSVGVDDTTVPIGDDGSDRIEEVAPVHGIDVTVSDYGEGRDDMEGHAHVSRANFVGGILNQTLPGGPHCILVPDLNKEIDSHSQNSVEPSILKVKVMSKGVGLTFRKTSSSSRKCLHTIRFRDVAFAKHGKMPGGRSQARSKSNSSCEGTGSVLLDSCDKEVEKMMEIGESLGCPLGMADRRLLLKLKAVKQALKSWRSTSKDQDLIEQKRLLNNINELEIFLESKHLSDHERECRRLWRKRVSEIDAIRRLDLKKKERAGSELSTLSSDKLKNKSDSDRDLLTVAISELEIKRRFGAVEAQKNCLVMERVICVGDQDMVWSWNWKSQLRRGREMVQLGEAESMVAVFRFADGPNSSSWTGSGDVFSVRCLRSLIDNIDGESNFEFVWVGVGQLWDWFLQLVLCLEGEACFACIFESSVIRCFG
ncbi:hypothetical protein L1887_11405 [Cichorium endivia]|nr:hypothetical protein L1887_11405 [Cichorium endivia]